MEYMNASTAAEKWGVIVMNELGGDHDAAT